jgi:SAM-dependent methyltransferase
MGNPFRPGGAEGRRMRDQGEGFLTNPQYEKWKSLQSHWDDDDFLRSLTPLMKLRYRRLDEMVEARLQKAFRDSGSVPGVKPLLLDLGAGRGEFALFLRQRGREGAWEYLGLEPSGEQLGQRDVREFSLGFIRGEAERVPLRDMSADGVLIKEAIDHCYDPLKVLSEARRLLKPGGILLVSVTNDRSYFKRILPKVNRRRKSRQTDHLFFFGPKDLEQLARKAGFDRVRVQTYNYLKLPRILERLLGSLGPSINSALLDATDSWGRILSPDSGGGILLEGTAKH